MQQLHNGKWKAYSDINDFIIKHIEEIRLS